MSRRLANVVLMGLLGVVMVVPAGPVSAADAAGSAQADVTGLVVPSSARPGDRVVVDSSGWPAGAQVQAAVCGDLGIGGSKTCQLSGAMLGRAAADGRVRLEMVVAKPPRPCPCVLRITTFSSVAVTFDAPLTVIGHRVGTPPVPVEKSGQIELSDVEVTGGGAGRWFGLTSEATLKVTVQNTGSVKAAVPPLRHAFSVREVGADETYKSGLIVPAKQERTIEIPVEVPAGFGGDFRAVVYMSDGAIPSGAARWSTRPWALFGFFAAMVLLTGLVVRAPARRGKTTRARAEDLATDSDETSATSYPLPDVVFVEQIGGVLVNPRLLRRSRLLNKVGGRITLEDLARIGSRGAPADGVGESAPLPADSPKSTEIAWSEGRHARLETDMI